MAGGVGADRRTVFDEFFHRNIERVSLAEPVQLELFRKRRKCHVATISHCLTRIHHTIFIIFKYLR